ncbi:MAG: hypothetical protein JSS49_29915 [Planctomycetes bacterium]|nr:hypothetical protein [Planctomycetota bacterium]
MSFADDEVAELKLLCPDVCQVAEGGCTFLLLPGLHLPEGCKPAQTDALLCPTARDGYNSRLFFAEKVASKTDRNWNATGVRIAERNWHAYSWKTNASLRLAQMVAAHLRALI